jgi:hypothetical protein
MKASPSTLMIGALIGLLLWFLFYRKTDNFCGACALPVLA